MYNPRGWTTSNTANPLRIGVPTRSLFESYVNVVYHDLLGNNISFGGFAIDLFEATVKQLPFYLPYDFFPFDGTYDALVEQVYLKVCDFLLFYSICFLIIFYHRYNLCERKNLRLPSMTNRSNDISWRRCSGFEFHYRTKNVLILKLRNTKNNPFSNFNSTLIYFSQNFLAHFIL